MKLKVLSLVLLICAIAISAWAADKKKPVQKWTCQDFLVIDEQFQPKVFYAATAYAKGGKPDGSVIDIDGTEKVLPVVVSECKKSPQESFWKKLGDAWKKYEAEAKAAAKKVEKKF
jgi:acid stress chaperone HdeA